MNQKQRNSLVLSTRELLQHSQLIKKTNQINEKFEKSFLIIQTFLEEQYSQIEVELVQNVDVTQLPMAVIRNEEPPYFGNVYLVRIGFVERERVKMRDIENEIEKE